MEGVQLDLISREKLEKMSSADKLKMILKNVKDGKIVVLESGLTPEEEAMLIELTMREIDHENFIGIEIETYPYKDKSLFDKLMGKKGGRLTVVGPANRLKTLQKREDLITALVQLG